MKIDDVLRVKNSFENEESTTRERKRLTSEGASIHRLSHSPIRLNSELSQLSDSSDEEKFLNGPTSRAIENTRSQALNNRNTWWKNEFPLSTGASRSKESRFRIESFRTKEKSDSKSISLFLDESIQLIPLITFVCRESNRKWH